MATSVMVSNVSILLVAIYQLITIKVDPFDVKNIITTTRCVITCVLTWVLSVGLSIGVYAVTHVYRTMMLYITIISLATTSICYVVIYRSIAGVSSDGNVQLEERKKENKRVLQTFCLILGTSVFFSLYPITTWAILSYVYTYEIWEDDDNACYLLGEEIMLSANWIANCVIYWWRLKEFRSMISGCKRRSNAVEPMA